MTNPSSELVAELRKRSPPQCWRHPKDKRVMSEAADRIEELTRISSTVPSSELVEKVARAVKANPTEEPEMPGLSSHFPKTDYHGAAQYLIECDCGFKTRLGNYYVTKAEWAAHAIESIRSSTVEDGRVAALEDLLAEYGDRVRMARAEPASKQWLIDEAISNATARAALSSHGKGKS